jgi:hypothetical protein
MLSPYLKFYAAIAQVLVNEIRESSGAFIVFGENVVVPELKVIVVCDMLTRPGLKDLTGRRLWQLVVFHSL